MTKNLFEISDDLLALDALLDEIGGDISDAEAEAAVDAWLKELGAERDSKLEAYAYLIKENEARAAALKEEAARLKARREAAENKADRLKTRLEIFLKVQGIDRIQTERFTFALQKPGGKPRVAIAEAYEENPVELPERFRRVKFEADLNAIREALEIEDPEVEGIGIIMEPEKRLRIR